MTVYYNGILPAQRYIRVYEKGLEITDYEDENGQSLRPRGRRRYIELENAAQTLQTMVDELLASANALQEVANRLPPPSSAQTYAVQDERRFEPQRIVAIKEVDGDIEDSDMMSDIGYEITTDQQIVQILIDGNVQCCEHYGYITSQDDVQSFVGAQLLGIQLVDSALNVTDWGALNATLRNPTSAIFVNLLTDRGLLQFVLYNSHNGYYGHNVRVTAKSLNYESNI